MVQSVTETPAFPFERLTMVIPTFKEQDNIQALYADLACHTPGVRVIVVDDSPDDLTKLASYAAGPSHPELDILFEHRAPEYRHDGLAGAVRWGAELAKKTFAVVDADRQHPIITVPAMLAVMDSSGVDLVMGSRYVPGGSASGLNGPVRHAVSRLCTLLAKLAFPRQLRGVSDPLTGCFMVRRSCVDLEQLQADGFKILLELLVTHNLSFAEVPLVFAAREAGDSKGDLKNGIKFLKQLVRLRFGIRL